MGYVLGYELLSFDPFSDPNGYLKGLSIQIYDPIPFVATYHHSISAQ